MENTDKAIAAMLDKFQQFIEIELPYGHFRRARASLRGGPDAG